MSLLGMVLTAFGIQTNSMSVMNGLLTGVALLIVMALRSGMKTEAEKTAITIAEQLAAEVGNLMNAKNPVSQAETQVEKTIPLTQLQTALEEFKKAITPPPASNY